MQLCRSWLDIFDFIDGLLEGDPVLWLALGAIAATIAFFALYQKITGRSFVKDSKERRRAHNRRYHVLWKYERDD